jgi:hypothetical protein
MRGERTSSTRLSSRRNHRWPETPGQINTPQFTATTDFETHRLWVNQPSGATSPRPTKGGRISIAGGGYRNNRHSDPSGAQHRQARQPARQIVGDRPVVLHGGGFGVGPVNPPRYSGDRDAAEIVVVASRNASSNAGFAEANKRPPSIVTVLGFTDQIDELMAAPTWWSQTRGLTPRSLTRGRDGRRQPNPRPESRNSTISGKCRDQDQRRHAAPSSACCSPTRAARELKANAKRLGHPPAFVVAEKALARARQSCMLARARVRLSYRRASMGP